MEESVLSSQGLTKNEAKVYLALLKEGNALAGIITQKTGIHRRNVYDSLERLMEKGLVSYVTIDNRKFFSPASPERFIELIGEERESLNRKEEQVKKILPALLQLRKEKSEQDVRFFRGVGGLKTVYEDILRTKKDYLGYGSGSELEEVLKHYLRHFINRRVKAKIKLKMIYAESDRTRFFTRNPLLKVRFLPNEFSSHASLRVYGDKVAIVMMSMEDPLAILIKNKKIADGYRGYFEVLWNAAKD